MDGDVPPQAAQNDQSLPCLVYDFNISKELKIRRWVGWFFSTVVVMILPLVPRVAHAQTGVRHFHEHFDMRPGEIGSRQLNRGRPLRGYFQPVRLEAPSGAKIAMVSRRDFGSLESAPLTVGMLIGQVYRLRITNIEKNSGAEVFPTIEVIDRLYPPPGQKARFAIPVELTQQELELAIAGSFVTRVIYLEDPQTALPYRGDQAQQPFFDVSPNTDPLRVADQIGRPVAILRMGGRLPGPNGPDENFLFGSPPLERYTAPQFHDTNEGRQEDRHELAPLPSSTAAVMAPMTIRGSSLLRRR